MAQQITRLLPHRDYDEHEVINLFSLDTASGEAGSFVKVTAGDFSKDSVEYVARADAFLNTLGNGTSNYPETPQKVTLTTGTGDAGAAIGMLLRDVREVDENGESLHFYNQKKDELRCVVSGECVPILKRGHVAVNSRAFVNGVVPNVGDSAVLAANGQLTGVAPASLSTEQRNATVGKFLGTGDRESQKSTDAFDGPYAILDFSV